MPAYLRSLTGDVKTMEGNDETAERLGDHVCRLSDVLERVRKHSKGSEKGQTIDGMNEMQKYVELGVVRREAARLKKTFSELQSVQQQIKELQAQQGMKKFWSSDDNDGSLKKLQEQVRAALEEIQVNILPPPRRVGDSRRPFLVTLQLERLKSR